jgi:esterase/lipase superfamily enzyme
MHHERHRWYSQRLGRDMETLVFGHSGAKLIVFPTSYGTCWEWPDRRMHHVIGDWIEAGWFQMYCVDQVHTDGGWYSKWAHPGARAWRQLQYDAYLREEVVPLTYVRNPNPYIITAGASFGAYDAMCFALRHPDVVRRVIGMSGMYDIRAQTNGYSDENVYRVNPMEFMAHEHDPARLAAFRRQDVILALGETDYHIEQNRAFSGMLWGKGIGNALRVWQGFAHDWPWWERMLRLYLRGHD